MEIKFIGNGSGFSRTNNNAFFEYNNDLILIDCSMLNMNKIMDTFDFDSYDNINVFITHTHADHISGIPNLVQYLYYVKGKKTNIMINSSLKQDILDYMRITGIPNDLFNLVLVDKNNLPYLISCIRTNHTSDLPNGSYGFVFRVNDKMCLYTGDTNTLEPFKKYLSDCDEAYIDTSYSYGVVHLKWEDIKDNLPLNTQIYLMHLDDEEALRNEIEYLDNVNIAEITNGYERKLQRK